MKRITFIVDIIVFVCLLGVGISYYLNQKVTDYYYLDYTPSYKLGKFTTLPVCRIIKESKPFDNDSIAYWDLYESNAKYMEQAKNFLENKDENFRKAEEYSGKPGLQTMKDLAYQYELELKTHHSLLVIRRPRYVNSQEIADSIRIVWPDSIHHLNGAEIFYYPFD